jgi:acetaldehyde dehydrogenase/alcohol dehydrogenase
MEQTYQETAELLIEKARIAAAVFQQLNQKETDKVVEAVFRAAFNARISLAKMAAEETGIGVFEHKVIKNTVASQMVYESIRHMQTVGIISDDPVTGITEIAQPLGPILAVIPITNPTATILYKALICLKSRNPVIFSVHRNGGNCGKEAVRICYEAALKAGAPDDCLQIVPEHSRELTQALMTHPGIALILATGGTGLVRAAYSSGNPAIGVGPGNVPVLIDISADIPFAVENILLSKTFDNGTICASEQSIIVEEAIAKKVLAEFARQGAYILDAEETRKLERAVIDPSNGQMNGAIVGKSVGFISALAGISVPPNTSVLIAPMNGIGRNYPLSGEVLAPVLTFYRCKTYQEAVKTCIDLNYLGGIGHTVSIFANNEKRISDFSRIMNAGRIVVNTPSAQGAATGTYNTLTPALTLGCGTGGKNITTENISTHHLINIQRVARRRPNFRWMTFDLSNYFNEKFTDKDLDSKYYKNY